MHASPRIGIFAAHGGHKWILIPISIAVALSSCRSFFVLQLLSADLIFAALLAVLAALVALLVLLVLAVGYVSDWSLVTLAGVWSRTWRKAARHVAPGVRRDPELLRGIASERQDTKASQIHGALQRSGAAS